MPYLVIHDVDAIQEYIFATDRLQEIQGASALIDHLNRDVTEERVRTSGGDLIYANGGAVAAEFTTPEAADNFCRQIDALYVDVTISGSSTGIVQEYDNGGGRQAFNEALIKALAQLRQQKDGRQRQTQLLTNAFFHWCDSCGVYPANEYDRREPEGFVCAS